MDCTTNLMRTINDWKPAQKTKAKKEEVFEEEESF